MMHVARGVDSQGVLHVDIAVNGNVPVLPDTAQIIVLPYTEDYIQTGPSKYYGEVTAHVCLKGLNTLSLYLQTP